MDWVACVLRFVLVSVLILISSFRLRPGSGCVVVLRLVLIPISICMLTFDSPVYIENAAGVNIYMCIMLRIGSRYVDHGVCIGIGTYWVWHRYLDRGVVGNGTTVEICAG